jgi:hypothetical protein
VPWSSFNKRTSKLLFALRSGCRTLTNLKSFVTIGLLSSKVYAVEALSLVSLFFFICSYLDLFLFFSPLFLCSFFLLVGLLFSFRFCSTSYHSSPVTAGLVTETQVHWLMYGIDCWGRMKPVWIS